MKQTLQELQSRIQEKDSALIRLQGQVADIGRDKARDDAIVAERQRAAEERARNAEAIVAERQRAADERARNAEAETNQVKLTLQRTKDELDETKLAKDRAEQTAKDLRTEGLSAVVTRDQALEAAKNGCERAVV